MSGVIYFIGSPTMRAVKIGYSRRNPKARLKSCQTGSADDLYLLAQIPGTMSDERALHRRFAKYNMRGEWFEFDPIHDQYLRAIMYEEMGI